MIENAFAGAARDGAGQVEVALRLQQALQRLSTAADERLARAAKDMAARALEYADRALPLDSEKARLRDFERTFKALP